MSDLSAPEPPRSMLLERMLFFSDAVFAIVLTLMALDLRLPPGTDGAHLAQGLIAARPEIDAFIESFALVGLFWMVHLITLRALAQFDWTVAIVNLVFLFTITLTPFATALVSHYGDVGLPWQIYSAVIILISAAQCALILASHRDEERLVRAEHHGRAWFRVARGSTPGLAFAIGLVLSVTGIHLASFCWVLVIPLMALARWIAPDPADRRAASKRSPATASSEG